VNLKELLTYSRALLRVYPSPGVAPKDLAKVVEICEFHWLDPGQLLCDEGEQANDMYVLLEGAIRVERLDPNGTKRELCRLAAPALLGHMAVIDNSPRSASCTATTATLIGSLNRTRFTRELGDATRRGVALRRILLTALTTQLNTANNRIRQLIFEAAPVEAATASPKKKAQFAKTSARELEKIAGILDGWRIDGTQMSQLERMKVVLDDDAKRNPRNKRGPGSF